MFKSFVITLKMSRIFNIILVQRASSGHFEAKEDVNVEGQIGTLGRQQCRGERRERKKGEDRDTKLDLESLFLHN